MLNGLWRSCAIRLARRYTSDDEAIYDGELSKIGLGGMTGNSPWVKTEIYPNGGLKVYIDYIAEGYTVEYMLRTFCISGNRVPISAA